MPAIAIVTGGAGAGIGGGISRQLARRGWSVVIADADVEAAAQLCLALTMQGLEARPAQLELRDESSVRELVRTTVAEVGPPGLLVNSAAIGFTKPIAEVELAEWVDLIDVNLTGAFVMSRSVLPHMVAAGGGVVINIGSVQALGPGEGYAAYAATKSALVGLSRGIAADYGRFGVRAHTVHPGFVDSPLNHLVVNSISKDWIARYVETRQMLPYNITPDDVGSVVAFLASPDARAMTATEVVVDAGSSQMAFDKEPLA